MSFFWLNNLESSLGSSPIVGASPAKRSFFSSFFSKAEQEKKEQVIPLEF